MSNFNSPIPRAKQPAFHEGSSMRSVRDSDANAKNWIKSKDTARALEFISQATQQNTRQIEKLRHRIVGGAISGGWDWMYASRKELDPRLDYYVGKWAYISALNPLVTTGMIDLVSGTNTKACQGLWECCQNVPAANGGKFNVPVFPYPAGAAVVGGATFLMGTTVPSGYPLVGDLDLVNPTSGSPILHWIYRGDIT